MYPGGTLNLWLYAGDFGLMDYNARWYSPSLGRFTQPDTIIPNSSPQSLNRYSYVVNNPINLIDPTGHVMCHNSSCEGGNSNGGAENNGHDYTEDDYNPPASAEEDLETSTDDGRRQPWCETHKGDPSCWDFIGAYVESLMWPFNSPRGEIPDTYYDVADEFYGGYDNLISSADKCHDAQWSSGRPACNNPFWSGEDPAMNTVKVGAYTNQMVQGNAIFLTYLGADPDFEGNYDSWWLYSLSITNPLEYGDAQDAFEEFLLNNAGNEQVDWQELYDTLIELQGTGSE